jgi:hypothetical protein
MKVIGLIGLFIIITLIDMPAIIKKTEGRWKFLIIYGFIIITGFTISLLQIIKKAPISPSQIIEGIIKGFIGET